MRFMANYVKMMAVAITAAQRADAKAKQLRRNFCKYCFENWDVSVKILTFIDSLKRDSNRKLKAPICWYILSIYENDCGPGIFMGLRIIFFEMLHPSYDGAWYEGAK